MIQKYLHIIVCFFVASLTFAQSHVISGRVADAQTNQGVGFSYIHIPELSVWTVADNDGLFSIHNIPSGNYTITITSLGYEKMSTALSVDKDIANLNLTIHSSDLRLDDVVVVAERKKNETTTSYNIDRLTLDNQQVLNLNSVSSLLPGGKTVNNSLISDDRIALRSSSSEKGNPEFGTAIEIDGVRMDNNAMVDETTSASTRGVAASDIQSIDVITGIPSVEYGDLSNGVVKINLHKGKSPYIFEAKVNPSTRQLALNKGFDLGLNNGVLNISYEYAESLKDIASPYTSFKRNVFSLRYNNVFLKSTTPLSITMGTSGNIGGYNSKKDPDSNLDSYTKKNEKALRLNFEGNILLNKSWITDIVFKANLSLQSRLTETNTNQSSSSSQPQLHVRETGYHVAGNSADADIVLGPIGYWYVLGFNEQKPVSFNMSLKANRSRRTNSYLLTKTLVGAEMSVTGNKGRGEYYNDMALAPTYREYRYDKLPSMSNYAIYAEERLTCTFTQEHSLMLNIGLRDDITHVAQSAYGTVSSMAPRLSARYMWQNDVAEALVHEVSVHTGWGRSVKLPSFQVLYPREAYRDILTFTPGSDAENKAYYAYYTHVSKALYNESLEFQSVNQTDLGFDISFANLKVALSAFYNLTRNPYQMVSVFSPLQYKFTTSSATESLPIPSQQRTYSVDRQSGVVSVSGNGQTVELPYILHNTYTKNDKYINGNDIKRMGLEWSVDWQIVRLLSLRIDGNYYYYRGLSEKLIAGTPTGIGDAVSSSEIQPLIGYYNGGEVPGSVSVNIQNGSASRLCNQNYTLTLHIPQARIIMMIKAESSLLNYKRQLSEYKGHSRGIMLQDPTDVEGIPYDGQSDHYVALYPEYYSTWDNPSQLIPFSDALAEARQNNPVLYQQLVRLIVRSNNSYFFNPNRISPYCSFNFLVTKEIGNHVAISFYANNFYNTMHHVHQSQTGIDASLYNSVYVPKFYYGLSLKLKI